MIDRLSNYVHCSIEEKIFPGCAVGIIKEDLVWCGGFGKLTYDPDAPAVSATTVYDCASLTKVIPVSCLALKMIEDTNWTTDTKLIEYLPSFAGKYREFVTVWHLLTHTLDIGFALSAIKDKGRSAIVAALLNSPLKSAPGTVFSYANATSVLLGWAIEGCLGMDLPSAANRYLFKPLGMTDATFNPENISENRVAPTEIDFWRKRIVCKEVHDESAYALRPGIVGSAGLFASVTDLVRFIGMLVGKGVYCGQRFFTPETIALMHTNALSPEIGCAGLGFELDQPFMGTQRTRNTFGKTGFTGCSMAICPERNAAIVLLSNHTFPQRYPDRSVINKVRSDLADIVFSS